LLLIAGCGGSGGGSVLGIHTPGPHVSAAEQAALPTQAYALGTHLCAHPVANAKVPPEVIAAAHAGNVATRPQFEALKTALREHPYDTVTVSSTLSDPAPGEDRAQSDDMTIVQLAKTHLEPPLPRNACGRRFKAELQALIDDAG
jgi:hypothetical protein